MISFQRSRVVKGWTFDALVGVLSTDFERVFGTDHMRAKVGEVEAGHGVRCSLGRPVTVSRVWAVPVEIQAEPDTGRFPHLDAEIEVRPVNGGVEIAVEGTYAVPAGPLGWIADHTLLHGVATASLDLYLEDVAARLEEIAIRLEPSTGVPI